MTPTIALLGDVMLGRGVAERLADGAPQDVWSADLRELCGSCDLVVCNLECCISERGTLTQRVPRKPFFFRAPPVAIDSLRAVGVRAAGLANNHALDFETDALIDTLDLLTRAGIEVTGAGRSEAEARRGALIEGAGASLGLVAVSDHPAEYAAGAAAPGIAHADLRREVPGWVIAELERLRPQCDHLIAFLHWGPNMTVEPAGWQLDVAAELQRAGADAVAGHSAHVFHGAGWGEPGPLLFDLGDALDDYAVDRRLRNDLGVMALWRPGERERELELVGLALDFCHTRLARGEEAEWIHRRLTAACRPLGTRVERTAAERFAIAPG